MATILQGLFRSRFQVLSSRQFWFGEVQSFHPISWCVFQALFGNDRARILQSNNILPGRRSAGSYLDIKKHHRAYGSQILKFNHLPVIHIKATFNNTVITILDKNGERWLTSYCIFSLSISVISFLFFFCLKHYYFYFLEKTLGWVSAGTEGFKNARGGSSTAARQAGIAAAQKAISLGVDKARIKIRGIGTGRQGAVNGIVFAGVDVVSVTDVTPVPHNGCRPRKVRRV
ncbi:hypothetical protein pdam_00014024 [Pocillopora damicornis]|uniref:30S ribosomal protein S11 n=1 Tax=Pocillopora damicornis TaxID=46731 RepID=A0A3M6TUK8_POCDA|nr:28S ribosomal protein S11, mitochondrial-like isoform X1 [Pocillopora damicornis]RMX45095.1 hypothetical protein pdam_00014024 [Pocillopora damicornis]